MGISCSSKMKKTQNSENSEYRNSQCSLRSQSTSKEAIDYCDSQNLAQYMRTKPNSQFLSDMINKHQIYTDSIEQLISKIEVKGEVILRSYNEFTNSALKIKQIVLEFIQYYYFPYLKNGSDAAHNIELVKAQTMLLLVETTIILNCLMDRNFDEETEVWWNAEYYKDRIKQDLKCEEFKNENPIVKPILEVVWSIKQIILQRINIQIPSKPPIINSTAIAQVHLTQFYNDMKLEFIRKVDDDKQTLYVTGLNDKMKIEDLKFALYTLFTQFGEVLQIVMKRTQKLRGQAFIVFQNLTYATNAKVALNGWIIFDKPLVIEFANQRSVIFDRMEGKFYYKKRQAKELQPNFPTFAHKKNQKLNQQQIVVHDQEINNVLLVEQLPQEVSEQMLKELFQQYPGYQTLSLIAPRGLAFIEFNDEDQATVALKGLNNFRLSEEHSLNVKYAKRN